MTSVKVVLILIGIASAMGISFVFAVWIAPKMSFPASTTNETLAGNYSIAYIRPVFTDTAYHEAFYNFYTKYYNVTETEQVTQDLNLLKPVVYDSGQAETRMAEFLDHLKKLNANVASLTDLDLDEYNGNILLNGNGGKKYDVVLLDHQEYVTQKEYDTLKGYVAEGGTLLVLNSNVFYAEVKYDKDANTVQLIKGHTWEFDGKSARRSIGERWAEETSQWMGSNYLCSSCAIKFDNNPFGYRHFEEQYITNPDAKIILDYKAKLGESGSEDKVIATYHMDYQKGKVIVIGIYGYQVLKRDDFRTFLDSLLEKYAGLPQ